MAYVPRNIVSKKTCERCKETYVAGTAAAKYCVPCRPLVGKERSKVNGKARRERRARLGQVG